MHLFGVQSSTHHPSELIARFELFLEEFLRDLETTFPENRFDSIKEMLITQLNLPPKNLGEFTSRQYALAFKHHGEFDRIQKRIDALDELNYKQCVNDFRAFLSRENGRRIAILMEGKPTGEKTFRYSRTSQDQLKQLGSYTAAK